MHRANGILWDIEMIIGTSGFNVASFISLWMDMDNESWQCAYWWGCNSAFLEEARL